MSNGAANTPAENFLGSEGGLSAWLASFDHKKIALMFLGWILGLFLLGALLAGFLKLQIGSGPEQEAEAIRQLLTYHGIVMVFLVVVPAIPSILGIFLLPLQLGAANLALPRLTRCSLRFYIIGSLLALLSLVFAPVSSGWTLATPVSLLDKGAVGLLAFGLAFNGLSWAATGVNFIVTVHMRRAPGQGFFDLPILTWALYLTGYILVACGLLLSIVVLYLAGAAASGRGLFGPDTDPLVWQNYFWIVTTPAAFFALIPAVGVVTEVIAGVSRKAVAGYRTMVGALIGLLAVSFVSWGVHLIGHGQAPATDATFAVLSLLAVVPVALISYLWLATLHRGAIACAAPTTFVVAFLVSAGIGTMLGLFRSSLVVGNYVSVSLFDTAHTHYVLMGGVLTALLAGLHYWWPKMTGRLYHQLLGRFSGMLYLIGVNLAFFPQIVMGTKGVPQGLSAVPAPMESLATISSIGVALLLLALVLITFNLVGSLINGARADANPWGATTLEWQAASPPLTENFDTPPAGGQPYPGS